MKPQPLLQRWLSAMAWTSVLLAASTTLAAPAKSLKKEFVSACLEAFQSSESAPEFPVREKICSCAATESKHQGATDKALKAESEKIRKDPKYQIQDKHVLNALQYCTIEALDPQH